MNGYNDKGECHGYWEFSNSNINYHNGLFHGKYEFFWDPKKTNLQHGGYLNMGKQVGLWVYFNENNSLSHKEFFL